MKLRFNLTDFFAPLGPRGVEFSGPIWSPARLFINLANWSFVFVVPILYAAIYKFRKAHTVANIGVNLSVMLFFLVHHLIIWLKGSFTNKLSFALNHIFL